MLYCISLCVIFYYHSGYCDFDINQQPLSMTPPHWTLLATNDITCYYTTCYF